jgi:hypothetical protein
MTDFTHKNRLIASLVALVVSTSAMGTSISAATGLPEHPPLSAVAVLPAPPRLQRERRHWAAVRSIRARLVRRLHKATTSIGRRAQHVRPRLPVHEWYARGPPRESTQRG